MSTEPEPFFTSRKYLIFHIKSFREGSDQHFKKINNIFESENKQRRNIVVMTCYFKKRKKPARLCLAPILPHSRLSPLP